MSRETTINRRPSNRRFRSTISGRGTTPWPWTTWRNFWLPTALSSARVPRKTMSQRLMRPVTTKSSLRSFRGFSSSLSALRRRWRSAWATSFLSWKKIVSATSIVRFRDRDALTPGEMVDKHTGDVRVMSGYRNIESMLLSDGVLSRLCDSLGKSDCFDAIRAARDKALARAGVQHATDDFKPAAQAVHHAARSQLKTDTLRRIEAYIHARRAYTSGDGRHARIRKAEGRHLRPIARIGFLPRGVSAGGGRRCRAS